MLALVAALETGVTALVAAGTAIFVIGLSAVVVAVARRARVQVRPDLLGARGGLAIAGFTLTIVALAIGLAFGLQALGVPRPGTIACAAVALALVAGGPRLTAYLRRVMLSRPARGGAR